MDDQPQERATGTPPRGGDNGPAIAYYGLVGLIGAALAAWFLFSLLGSFLGGYCEFEAPGEFFLCGHSLLDLIAPAVAFIIAATLLPTARRLARKPSRLGPVVAAGVVVGIGVAVLPILLILWAADFSADFNIFGSKVPTAGLVLLFTPPLLWALQSAMIVRRQAARPEDPSGNGRAGKPDLSPATVAPELTVSHQTARSPSRLPIGVLAVALAGVVVGALVNRIWWKPPYVEQGLVLGAALLIAVVALVARRRQWTRRPSGASSVALVAGLAAGMVLGAQPPFTESIGTITLRLERPIERVESGEARCSVGAGGEDFAVSRYAGSFTVILTSGEMFDGRSSGGAAERRDDGLDLVIQNPGRPYRDLEGEIGSTPNSALEGRREPASGSLRFAKLAAFPYDGGPPRPLEPAMEGTIEWTCPDEAR